ncbi:transcription termination/antitermination protein NusG [Salipiger bermudensis]|uniref:transcription termination/antitermination protein NusG n=1 Tax=Salipiger bermudensis TaxID=344736 RepID=UPI001CD1C61C|nr:hypothetical protein [Salipiger bermudensis]MCA0961166.1 hypothetical protein [Salipiger bermudensis]
MTWYLGITTTRLIAPRLGAEKIRGEFAVEQQLRGLGIEAHAPRRVTFVRSGKKRYAEAQVGAYLPGYVFADIPALLYMDAASCRGLSRTMMAIPLKEVQNQVQTFIAAAAEEEAEADRIQARNDRAAMSQFSSGDALEIISGPFMDQAVEFQRMVQNAEGWPEIIGNASLFGQSVRIRIDPLDVRRAG